MASGVPVVASAIPGFSQVVASGSEGLLVPPRDPQAWARALDNLVADRAARRRMGEAGVRKAQGFDWRVVVDGILGVYAEARERAFAQLAGASG